MEEKKKLVIGWFSLTCSEDSAILFTELLNDRFDEWKEKIEFRYLKILKTKNSIAGLDVAFIEGAISSNAQISQAQKIRANSKYVVAVGACACTGMPSASRNEFHPEEINYKIAWYMSHFDYSAKVKKLSDAIQVDDEVPGCPMTIPVFLEMLDKYLKIFKIT